MECYLPMNGNEILIHSTTQMDFGKIMLIEISQTQKDHILYDSICMKCLEQANPYRQKAD